MHESRRIRLSWMSQLSPGAPHHFNPGINYNLAGARN
jgi:hypothetical protein